MRRWCSTHVSTSHWGANVPAFHADGDATARVVEHGPPAQRLLAVADGHGAALIVARHARAALARERRPPRRQARALPGDDRRPARRPAGRARRPAPAFDRAFLREPPGARGGRPHPLIGEPPGSKSAARATTLEGMSLFWRVVIVNAASWWSAPCSCWSSRPASVSAAPTAAEIEVLIAGTLLVIGAQRRCCCGASSSRSSA